MKKIISTLAVTFFSIGILPNLLVIFFSAGVSTTDWIGLVIFIFSVVTLMLLLFASINKKLIWILFSIQFVIILMILVQTFGDAPFYIGT